MASKITEVTSEIADYLQNTFGLNDSFLDRIIDDAEKQGIPAIHIGREQGRFLQFILQMIQAQCVVEIGSLAGYSSVILGRMLPEHGALLCFEKNDEYCKVIQHNVERAALPCATYVYSGSALDTLHILDTLSQPIDCVFIDADKPNYKAYIDTVLPYVRVGGCVIADNTLAWGEIAKETTTFEPKNVYALQEYNKYVTSHPQLHSTLVPLGDGMTLSLKVK